MKIKMQRVLAALLAGICAVSAAAIDHPGITMPATTDSTFTLIADGQPTAILFDPNDARGISIAVNNLIEDMQRVCGNKPQLSATPTAAQMIIVGSIDNPVIKRLGKAKKIDLKQLQGKTEKYLLQTVDNPLDGVDQALVIAGSDRRGTIYGIYELSEQLGVSPWYMWADVPVDRHENMSIKPGQYTAGEPVVRYRGIFLNDEAPCLTSWVRNTYGTDYGGHDFYADVFELILRLRGNYMWPAMWGWAFYADDPLNSDTADEMGIIMGTSHHEPMARNHQEWARHRGEYGAWDYATNKDVLDRFFSEGVARVADREDIITIGMRGDGDAPMGGEEGHDHDYVSQDEANLALLRRIIDNQRKIIADVTGQKPEKHPQLWALYKEVQKYYDMGLRVPDDVIILLCDDNWGDVRNLPNAQERKHPGGWGMYYHVDYVGAPRNSKWLNVTPIQNMWEQLSLTHEYGVDKLWVLNVGDLKPMEYPITLFLDMAWNPDRFTADNLLDHTLAFCKQQFGESQGEQAARILNLYSKYNGRCTPEMLDNRTYNLATGEWKQVRDEYMALEAEALRQYLSLEDRYRDAYMQLILFPVQAMANLYDLYYSTAMNHYSHQIGDHKQCAYWADRVRKAFDRDHMLCDDYNNVMSDGKWKGMMTQKHIGYKTWNDNFPADTMPYVYECDAEDSPQGGFVHMGNNGVVSIEAEHYYDSRNTENAEWTVIPYMGRTLSGITLMPRQPDPQGAELIYRMNIPACDRDSITVHIVMKSTLPFERKDGHRYNLSINGEQTQTINFNGNLNENPENVYSVYYPTVASRVHTNQVKFALPKTNDNMYELTFAPIDRGLVLEKIVVDYGGYTDTRLFLDESPIQKQPQHPSASRL